MKKLTLRSPFFVVWPFFALAALFFMLAIGAWLSVPASAQIGGGSADAGLIVLQAAPNNLVSPLDATTYFFGIITDVPPGTSATIHRIPIPVNGVIVRFDLFIYVAGTAGTAAENSTYSVRLNDTTDVCAITVDHDADVLTSATCSQAVSTGDYIEIKWLTPTWTTNPTNVRHSAVVTVSSS